MHNFNVKIKDKTTFVNYRGKSRIVNCNEKDNFDEKIGIIIGILKVLNIETEKINKISNILIDKI